MANTLTLAVRERTREISLLRGVGVTRTGVWLMLVLETLLVAVCAAALGVVLGAAFGSGGAEALTGAGGGVGGVFGGLTGVTGAGGNESLPVSDLVMVGVGGVLAALLAAGVAALGAVRTRVTTS
ncbi:FtsX-like permease family protein [Dietzia cinnamea]|uniref:FtsX-like permease family protein n=1 Tax=Dietzia cinnamea TaxID=321318 RepID=UPI00223A99EE|nr:ABC transporter permease [Dietzia cinnamea]MCT2060760.1 ABC transporter permease [Dietzia cinnamea]MCT2237226.1 ABC transporter permease [Dietzia cinnamea]MCT2301908.1 ABC transporter permease [Dietzia cinnamea]